MFHLSCTVNFIPVQDRISTLKNIHTTKKHYLCGCNNKVNNEL